MTSLERRAETSLWPLVDQVVRTHGLAGLAVAVVQDGEVALARGFGTRDVRTGAPVTPETLFHLASVSKTFVAAAVVGLTPALDLDAPVVRWLPDLTLADGRQAEVTLRHLLTHTSGIPDVTDYGWHDPLLGDDALAELVRGLSSARLSTTPGTRFAYCNLGYEVLGHVLATVRGTTFEEAMTTLVLHPAGMDRSTFLRGDVAPDLAASPHVGAPLIVPGDSYPYTRRHAPSSTLHSSVAELSRWMIATLDDAGTAARRWQPEAEVGDPPWDESVGLGWFLGSHRGERTVGHAGADPGFTSRLVLVPERRTGVVALANSNTAPTGAVVRAALDLALDLPLHTADDLRLDALLPPITVPLGRALVESGADAAVDAYHRLTTTVPALVDVDDDRFVDGVWGAIELHRPDLVRPLLGLWTTVRPGSSRAWAMTGWAHLVDGDTGPAAELLQRAVDLDPGNEDAAALLRGLGA
ncbi:serine hydrolase domain-containing protein [Cellulomonas humilata]|uniref:CubicO group peptidase (Beta-lactamase class C family) n=1 Tax=Cellulomonas humilata TaxID=144055 RepID=A0ABU0EE30_9CELL|nr:serine hydrolase domain-containing protein [Cellulomonas humilata]MDQ0373515.1 CubicO group peptidase (beta-lactamase class C family) [Cellulomonas humilata]